MNYMPEINDGILFTYHGDVHRDTGGRTTCGQKTAGVRAVAVSHAQALVYQLHLCAVCYPNHLNRHRPGASRGRV